MSKRQLLFKPTEEEEQILENTGQINNWHDTVRAWMQHDKKLNRKQLADRIQNSLILVFTGIMAFMLGTLLPSYNLLNFTLVSILFISAFICVTYGSISIIWELMLNVGRR